ncbi:hypothetical protein LIS82_08860 [Cytobacillus solani]|uniref:hypothetical protein n=1 Tax=Cytobacillus solani TaxID=1637975 RepID=UPI00207AE90D|nr:hypothetical protein [Cytobacillus solani]USK56562.1 hypothetical protein LIS82_08860 [Cytobacillus solani]
MMDFFEHVTNNVLEMDKEHDEQSKRVQKSIQESQQRIEEKRQRFEERRKKREKHFSFLGKEC